MYIAGWPAISAALSARNVSISLRGHRVNGLGVCCTCVVHTEWQIIATMHSWPSNIAGEGMMECNVSSPFPGGPVGRPHRMLLLFVGHSCRGIGLQTWRERADYLCACTLAYSHACKADSHIDVSVHATCPPTSHMGLPLSQEICVAQIYTAIAYLKTIEHMVGLLGQP